MSLTYSRPSGVRRLISTPSTVGCIALFAINAVFAQIANFDFEDGQIPAAFTNGNESAPWAISSDRARTGQYSLRSNNLTSVVEWTVTVPAGTLVFDYLIEGRSLRFYIDGALILNTWQQSNQVFWDEFRQEMVAGTYTFRWEAASVGPEPQGVWIDNVRYGSDIPNVKPVLQRPGALLISSGSSSYSGLFEVDQGADELHFQRFATRPESLAIGSQDQLFANSSGVVRRVNTAVPGFEDLAELPSEYVRSVPPGVVGDRLLFPDTTGCGYAWVFQNTGNVLEVDSEPCDMRWDAMYADTDTVIVYSQPSSGNAVISRRAPSDPRIVLSEVIFDSNTIYDLARGPDGFIWATAYPGKLIKFTEALEPIAEFLVGDIGHLVIREDGLMATAGSSGILFFQPEYGYSEYIPVPSNGFDYTFVPGVVVDADNDGIPLWWETAFQQDPDDPADAAFDPDLDGRTNLQEFQDKTQPFDDDTDDDGLNDGEEASAMTDPLNGDTDGDGLSDGVEVEDLGTDPLSSDTDGDGMDDQSEVLYGLDPLVDDADEDVDNDLLTNGTEIILGTSPILADTDADQLDDGDEVDAGTDPLDPDTDDDGLNDGAEGVAGTDPLDSDSDGDGLSDGSEVLDLGTSPINEDTDGDLMVDGWEVEYGLDPLVNDADADFDTDGLSNIDEWRFGGDPSREDTDGDALIDGDEILLGTRLDIRDTDADRIPDGWEVLVQSDPLTQDDTEDADEDSWSAFEEYWNRTRDNDAEDFPRAQPWTTHQGNARHTGYQPISFDLDQVSSILFLSLTPIGIDAHPAIVHEDHLVVVKGKSLSVYSLANGAEVWKETFTSAHSVNPPSVTDGAVFVQTGNHSNDTYLRAYDIASGAVNFFAPHDAQWERYLAPTIDDGTVFINGGAHGGAYAFDQDTGKQQWFSSAFAQVDRWTPAVDEESAYGFTEGVLTAVDRETGIERYSIMDPNTIAYTAGTAVVLGGLNTATALNRFGLTVFDLADQQFLWSRDLESVVQPAAANGVIYARTRKSVYAFDEWSGALLWTWAAQESVAHELVGNLLITRDYVIVSAIGLQTGTYFLDIQTGDAVDIFLEHAGEKTLTDNGTLVVTTAEEIVVYDLGLDRLFRDSFETLQ